MANATIKITGDNISTYSTQKMLAAAKRAAKRANVYLSKIEIIDSRGTVAFFLYDNYGTLIGSAKNTASVGERYKFTFF